jgi:4-amino-4-deoxy-L-arabinose transferase-like glycosyltransferase
MSTQAQSRLAAPSTQVEARADSLPRVWIWAAVGLIALAAFALRAWSLRASLPWVDHPDEPNPITYVVAMMRSGDPNQQFFQKPSLFIYLLLSVLQLHYAWGVASGLYGDLRAMQITTHLITTVPEFFYWARMLSATVGALTVATAYFVGARAWSRPVGFVAALFVALLPYHLRFSQYVTTDALASWLVLLCFGACVLVLREGSWRTYIVAGAFAGLAASTKYNAGAVALTIVVAHMVGRGEARFAPPYTLRLLLAALVAMTTFVAGTPYSVLSFSQVSGGILQQWSNYGGGNGHFTGAWNLGGYLNFFWGDGLGVLGCLLVLVGLALMLRRDRRLAILWLGFALPSLLLHLSRPTHFMQNMLPLLVLCSLPFAAACVEPFTLLNRKDAKTTKRRILHLRALCAFALSCLLLPFLWQNAAYLRPQLAGDTRVQLLRWLEEDLPPGTRVAAELRPVPHPQEARWSEVQAAPAHDLAWYRTQGFAYVVASSKRWGSLELPTAYDALQSAGTPHEFGSNRRGELLGPRLIAFPTGLSADDVAFRPAGAARVGAATLLGVNRGYLHGEGITPADAFRAGDLVGLRSFWQVEENFTNDYFIFVHILDAAGNRVAQRDAAPWQGRYPTRSWQPGSLVVDVSDVILPPNIPPGDYRVVVGMFDPVTFARPPVTLDGVPQTEGMIEVTSIQVIR